MFFDVEPINLKDFSDNLQGIYEASKTDIGDVSVIASSLCAIFALFYIGNMIWKSWCQGKSIDFYATLRPFCIGLVIMNFSVFVNFIDAVMNIVNLPTEQILQSKQNSCDSQMREVFFSIKLSDNKDEETGIQSVEDEGLASYMGNLFKSSADFMVGFFADLRNKCEAGLSSFFISVLTMAGTICGAGVLAIGNFTKMILFYIGPFAFALSLIPSFSNSLSNWVSKYVTASLYLPCVNLVTYAIMSLFSQYLDAMTAGTEEIAAPQSSSMLVFLSLAAAFGYMSIPSIAGYVVGAMTYSSGTLTGAGSSNASMALTKSSNMLGNMMDVSCAALKGAKGAFGSVQKTFGGR